MDSLEVAMGLIAGAGDSRSYSMEAIEFAKEGNFTQARESIKKSAEAMVETHEIQTQLIRDEITGNGTTVSLLMVHAQDHLNLALITRDMAEEFILIHEKLKLLEGR